MKIFIKGTLLVLLVMVLTIPLGATGCKRNQAPAGTEIKIGVMGGLTGPAADTIDALLDELELIFNYVNQVEGGINGAIIDWQVEDNAGTPAGAVAAYSKLRDTYNPLLYFSVEDYYLLGAKQTINDDESVILTTSAIVPTVFTDPSRFFAVTIPTSDGFGGFVNWVNDDWGDKAGDPKIGVLYWSDMSSGLQWQMAQQWAMGQDVDIVSSGYSIGAQDLTAQLTVLKNADVDYIWMHGITPNAALAVNTYPSMGFDADVKFCFMEYVESDKLLDLVGEDVAGFYIYRSETPYSDGSEAAQYYTDIYEHAGIENEQSDFRHLITLKYVIEAAIEQAVTDVGWDNLDEEAIYEALLTLTNVDTKGNTGTFGFGPEKRLGVLTMQMAQFTATGTISIGDEIELPNTFVAAGQ
jgi:ABC-type branched-subunit amino acid transport system substrate-binding protein